jgi:carbonic anhydrase
MTNTSQTSTSETQTSKPLQILPKPNLSRRELLKLGLGICGTSTVTGWLGGNALAQALPTAPAAPSGITPDQALDKLMTGNQRFVAQRQRNPHHGLARLTEVATGQAPFATILSCADSRVVPEIAFDQGIGDLFVTRVAGNLARADSLASEEYAIAALHTPLLMILGHERCGAVTAALQGGELPGDIATLVAAIQPAIKAAAAEPGDPLTNAVKANVRLQVQQLLRSPVMAAAVQAGTLKVVGGYYDLDSGVVSLL